MLHDHMRDFLVRRTLWVYFPEPILRNAQREYTCLRGMDTQVVTGSRYLGVFIGEHDSEKSWLEEKVEGWTHALEVFAGVARRYPQTAYAILKKFLQ